MSAEPTKGAAAVVRSRHARDEGSALILVLVLIVVAGLVVVPLLSYATSVLRLNTAVSERSRDVEAAKGALRVVMSDPIRVFNDCAGGGSLDQVEVNGTDVSSNCRVLSEFGSLDALGLEVPIGAVATQLGAEAPASAVGGSLQSDPVPPYPASADWWTAHLPDTSAGYERWDPADGRVWVPELPEWPTADRTSGSAPYYFDMPGFDTDSGIPCKVFFPGRYDQPVVLGDIGGSRAYYFFVSGVYYFEQPITVQENADVVVGEGPADFESGDRAGADQTGCADNQQAVRGAANRPNVAGTNGGGATWVFGADAKLVVDDSAGSPTIRFNQRYAEEDGGGRVSIMTVNGRYDGSTVEPHDVPLVNLIPPSNTLDTFDEDNDLSTATPIDPSQYVPSCGSATPECELTDAARPAAPTLTVDGRRHADGGLLSSDGSLLLTWNELSGQDAGGALITGFDVTVDEVGGSGAPQTVCDRPGDLAFSAGTGAGGENQVSCYVAGLDLGTEYDVTVAAIHGTGLTGPATTVRAETRSGLAIGADDAPPAAPTGVRVVPTDVAGTARVEWTPGDPGDTVITGYEVVLEQTGAGFTTNEKLVASAGGRSVRGRAKMIEIVGTPGFVGYRVPAVNPNGGRAVVDVDQSTVPAGWTITASSDLDLQIVPPRTGAPTRSRDNERHTIDYVVTDPTNGDITSTGSFQIRWVDRYRRTRNRPIAHDFTAFAGPSPRVFELPFSHERGQPASVVAVDTRLVPSDVTVNWSGGNTVEVSTSNVSGGTVTVDFEVEENGSTDSHSGRMTIQLPSAASSSGTTTVGTCTVAAEFWYEVDPGCDFGSLADLSGPGGYRATVTAISPIGNSPAAASAAPDPTGFDGSGTASPTPPERAVEPWVPVPVIDLRLGSANAATVRIAGYVATPMGRISIASEDNDSVQIVGGVVSGTFDLDDAHASTVIGIRSDIVLQRTMRIVSTAGRSTSTAIVQVNEDSDYAINSWVVN